METKLSVILILAFLFFLPRCLTGQVNKQDSLALVDLYNSTDGPNWWLGNQSDKNWNLNRNVNQWRGVEIKEGRVTKIDLPYSIWGYAKLNGAIPSTIGNLTKLSYLCLYGDLSGGGIPQSIGNLVELDTLNLSRGISGEIPASIQNLKKLQSFILQHNQFTGEIPSSIGALDSLKRLSLYNNRLSGEIPSSIGNLVGLEYLNLNSNALTGEIPSSIGNLTKLQKFEIRSTNLTGQIPESIGRLINLSEILISQNNFTGEIPSSIGNLNNLNKIEIRGNNFTGGIPPSIGKLKALTYLDLSSNNITGIIPYELKSLTNLQRLVLSANNFYGDVPIELAKFPNLEILQLSNNNFNFANLEPLASADLSKIEYDHQENLILGRSKINGKTELEMKAGGKNTTYKWYYNMVEEADANDSKFTVPPGKDVLRYRCKATNILLPYLTLLGIPPADDSKTCWQTGQLTFCLSSGEWEKASGNNKIKTTNIISINDFLFFDGTMTIDTSALEIEANGEFYVDNIPLAQNLGIGKYTLALGKYKLKLMGDEKKITNFLNSELSKTAMIFGTPMKIDDLQFIKRNDTIGIKLNSSVSIPLLSAGCGNPALYQTNTDISLKNLEITNKGILSAGFQVENLGFLSQGCLKNASLEYDWKKDVLVGGAEVSISYFGDVGVGVRIEKGKIDSVAWKLDSNLPPIPFYLTIGVKGFYGHFAGLNNVDKYNQFNLNELDIKIGGIFTDFTTDNFYQAEVDGRIKLDGLLETKGKLQLLQPPGDILPYQIEGNGKMRWDYANKQLKFGYDGKFGTIDGQEWLANTDGELTFDYRSDIPTASGHFSADITLQKLPDKFPINLLNAAISIIGTVGSSNHILTDDPTHVHGIMYQKSEGGSTYNFPYIIDITKTWYQSGYIQFPDKSRVNISIEEKSGNMAGNVTKTFTVPENNQFGVIEIKSQSTAPISSITSPNGRIYSASSPHENILYTESVDKKEAFWSLFNADTGDWKITLNNPAQSDSIIAHFQLKEKDFKFSMNQIGNTAIVSWDVMQVEEGQTINIMLDDDNADFDGFRITHGDATLGSLSFTLDESTPDCNYYLYAQLVDEFRVVEAYADEAIVNPLASLAPPINFYSQYDKETGEFEFTWNENPTSEITGYILSVTDELGNDSVYAILNSNQTSISLFLEDFETKSAKIESYNQDWKIGCPTTALKLSTRVDNFNELEEPENRLNVFPNPTTGNCTIRYFVSEESNCEIRIFDILGNQIAQPLAASKTAGFHQIDFNYEHFPNGLYIIKLVNEHQTYTTKSILSK